VNDAIGLESVTNNNSTSSGESSLSTSRWVAGRTWAVSAALTLSYGGGVLADAPVGSEAPAAVPQESIFSSIKQAFNQDFDRQVIRGHFDVGSSPTRRYYCLVDAKTGKRSPNGVPGEPAPRPDGMTGIKASSVSTYSCNSAEQQGILVTTGYVLPANAQAAASSAPPPPAPVAAASATAAQPPAATSAERIDVAGIKLGMSPEEVRAVLKSKKLMNYFESAAVLSRPDARYVNTIATWTASATPGATAADRQGESYEVQFTPVPGKERAMVIVHSMTYLPANALPEASLNDALARKYGGFKSADGMPDSLTWRVQSDGSVQVGDACSRRGIVGGFSEFTLPVSDRPNLALKTALDEFQFQIQQCGVAIATEDHVAVKGDVTRVTVSAYSPVLGLAGATAAAQTMATARSMVSDGRPGPNL
jgi:hypothetical protein